MRTLSKTCPICHHTWQVRHNKSGLGAVFIDADFAVAMFDHLQTHTQDFSENRIKNYEYGKGVISEA